MKIRTVASADRIKGSASKEAGSSAVVCGPSRYCHHNMLKTARTDSGTTTRSTAGTMMVTIGYATATSGMATRAHVVDDRLWK